MEIRHSLPGGQQFTLVVSPGGKCICGDNKIFADCCAWIFEPNPRPAPKGAHLAVQLADLFPGTKVDAALAEVAALGPKGKVLLELARINHFVNSKTTSAWRKEQELDIARCALPTHLAKKVQYMYANEKRGGMFPKTSLLEAMRRVCLSPKAAAGQPDEVPLDRVVAFTIAAGMKVGEDFENASLGKASDEASALVSLQFAQRFYDRAVDLGVSLARCWIFLKNGVDEALKKFPPPQCVDLREEFRKALGCSWKAWLGVGVPVRGKYDEPLKNLGGDGFFVTKFDDIKDEEMRVETAKALEQMSAPEEWLDTAFKGSALLQYFKFYERPLYVDPKGRRFPFDLLLLERRVLDGTYWAVVESLGKKGDTKTREAVNRTWGKVFEWYVHELLKRLKSKSLTVLTDWADKFEAPEGVSLPDALIVQGDTMLVIEDCVSFPRPPVLVSGNAREIQKGFEDIWFGSGDRDSDKVRQVLRAIDGIRQGKLTVNGQVVTPPKRVIPVIAILRAIPRGPLVRDWITKVLIENKVDADVARSFIFLSVDELEELAAVLEREVPLAKSILPYTDNAHAREQVGGNEYLPEWLRTAMRDAFDELAMALFGKRLFDAEAGGAGKVVDASS